MVALALVAARLALPTYLKSYVNRVIDESADYGGRVETVRVHLWRGSYSILGVEIVKKGHAVPVPFFECPRVDCSLYWGALLHGVARGTILMDHPRLHFVDGPSPEETQTGADTAWLSVIDGLSPFRVDRARIVEGEVHFHTFHTSPPVHAYLSHVAAELTNLTNIQNTLDPLVAKVHATATAMESAHFELDVSLDPAAHLPTFDLATKLLDLDVTRLNSLARAYGDFDFERGRFDLVAEAAAKNGYVEGYAKPLFRDVVVLSTRDIGKDDPLQLLWEGLVGTVGAVFKNQSRDQFGTRIAFSGDLNNPRTSILDVIGNVLRNAFVRAYLPRLEGRVAPEGTTPEVPNRRLP